MATWTSAPNLVSIRARLHILYTAIEPVTPSKTVFPVSMVNASLYMKFVSALLALMAGDKVADGSFCDIAEGFLGEESLM